MTRTTLNVSFYCRKSKEDKDGLAPVELVIIINGRRTNITLPRKERPDKFKTAITSRRNSDIKDYLSAVRTRLNEIITTGYNVTAKSTDIYDFYPHSTKPASSKEGKYINVQ